MYSKDRKDYSVIVSLTKNVLSEFKDLNILYKEHVKKTFGKNATAFIDKDNYGKDRYRFTVKFKESELFPKEVETSLMYLVKWVITDLKIKILKKSSTMYGFFASKHKMINRM